MNCDNLVIRRPLPSDAKTWADMFYEIHREPTKEYKAVTGQESQSTAKAYCRKESKGPEFILTAFLDGIAVGWTKAQKDDPRVDKRGWYINGVETRVSCRRRGIARKLIMMIIGNAVQNGRDVYVAVRKENAPAIALFESCGFTGATNITHFSDKVHVFYKARDITTGCT